MAICVAAPAVPVAVNVTGEPVSPAEVINSQAGEIFRLNLESQTLNSFTDLETNRFECWVAAN